MSTCWQCLSVRVSGEAGDTPGTVQREQGCRRSGCLQPQRSVWGPGPRCVQLHGDDAIFYTLVLVIGLFLAWDSYLLIILMGEAI